MVDAMAAFSAALSGQYRIERELGSGGMATVYLAEDVKHHRRVAIKVLHPELSALLGSERFLKEIELTANLQHPHILPLFDSGSVGGLLYYVMPYVDGETLRGRLERERQLPIADAVRIATEVADALGYAHKQGVVHRDIKPENILLRDGRALVADFGIALAVEQAGGTRMTQTGLSLGTPQYMSPEQAMGEREIGPRSDIYSLGAVTYEMLSGEPPFTGPSSQAIVARVMTEEPRRLIPQRRSVTPALEDAVLTALEKLPADRFGSAAEFATGLTEGVAGRANRPRDPRPASAWRSPGVLGAAAAALAAVAFFVGTRTARPRTPIATFGRSTHVTWDQGLEIEPALSPDGRYVAYAAGTTADMRIYVRQVAGGRVTRLTDDSLDVQTNPSWSPDGSRILFLSNEGVFSAPSSGGAARPEMRPAAQGPIVSAVWAPDGRTIAYAVRDSVYIRDPDGQRRPLARIEEASLCQWSPSGDFVACASENLYYSRVGFFFGNQSPSRIVVVRVRDGAATTVTDSTSINQSPVWSHDGKWLYFVSSQLGPRDIYAVRISRAGHADGAPVRLTTGLGAHCISVSAGDARFAYDVYTATSNIWSLPFPPKGATQAAATAVTNGAQVIERATTSRDGKWLYYASNVSGTSQLYRQRLPVGDPVQLTFGQADDFAPDPSPDGREVAFHSWRSGTRDLYVMPLDGGPVQRATSGPLQNAEPVWSPDGTALAYSIFPTFGSWVVRRGADGIWGTPVQRTRAGSWVAWSPDGRWIAYTSYFLGGSLMIVNPDSGAPRVVLDSANSSEARAELPVWSSDSRTLYFKSHDAKGNAAFWSVPVTGGQPTLLTRFDDLTRPSYRAEWSVGSGRMYFTIDDRQSDVWVMNATPR
jgi:eukaryotic-like serine/threonine-protein kinase